MLQAISFPAGASLPPAAQLQLEVFDKVPPWAIVHAAIDNRNAPLIGAGEVVVIEADGRTGWLPTEGGLFLIEYVSPPHSQWQRERRTREIVQTFCNTRGQWCAGALRRGGTVGGVLYCVDGPYRDEMALADKLIGKVVGILASGDATGRAQ